MTFGHAGDLGDIIYSLPVMRALGGGTLCLHTEKWTREPMTEARSMSLRALLLTQPYVEDVRWLLHGENPDVNLNDFRADYFRAIRQPNFPARRNLCEWMLATHKLDPSHQYVHWLDVPPIHAARVIINRTGPGRIKHHTYHNPEFPWPVVLEKYHGEIAFVGHPVEHQAFCRQFGPVPYQPTINLLELAMVISGAELFIGNQSCAYAIAEGLKKQAILEVCPWMPNCLFGRPDCHHGWNASVYLPELSPDSMAAA